MWLTGAILHLIGGFIMNGFVKWSRRVAVVVPAAVLAGAASADAVSTDISALFDSVDLSSISTKIMALAVTIVGIALVIKGPSIVKRLIAKI